MTLGGGTGKKEEDQIDSHLPAENKFSSHKNDNEEENEITEEVQHEGEAGKPNETVTKTEKYFYINIL